VLQQIGFAGKTGTAWTKLFKVATGNLIITALGFVPGERYRLPASSWHAIADFDRLLSGYYVTILTIEILGRKWIQTQGFLMAALFREHRTVSTLLDRVSDDGSVGLIAGQFHKLSKVGFIVCFSFLQVRTISASVNVMSSAYDDT
jgi:PHS family inorganic phosphate transporter-like MFS transporter